MISAVFAPTLRASEELNPLLPTWVEIAISVGSVLLLVAVLALILVLVLRRRRDH